MPISVRLGEDIEARLEHLAQLTGRTKTYYIRQAVIEKLEDLEDIYMAEQVLENPGSHGHALTGRFSNLWRYRVGAYRIVCRIEDERLVVLVVGIGHRRDIY